MPNIDKVTLKGAKCQVKRDKIIFVCLKYLYFALRALYIFIPINKKGTLRFGKRRISFTAFLYKSIEFLRLDNSFLIVFDLPEYDYKFCSLVTRKLPNFLIEDMYQSMTIQEKAVREHFNPKQGDIVIDIGAAFGIYTIISSMNVGTNGKVIAIEAHPDVFDMLERNIRLNKLNNVTCLNYAVYSTEMKVNFYRGYTILPEKASEEQKRTKLLEVNANTLDNLLNQNGMSNSEIHWIKVDVEGAELEVLKGAYNTLSNNRNITLLIEVHKLADGSNLYQPIKEYLESHNFKITSELAHKSGEMHLIATKYF